MTTTRGVGELPLLSAHNRMMKIDMPDTVRSEPYDKLRTGPSDPFVVSLSNHERPFDRLRVNGINTFLKVNELLKSEGELP